MRSVLRLYLVLVAAFRSLLLGEDLPTGSEKVRERSSEWIPQCL